MAIGATPASSNVKWGAILIIALMLLSGVAVYVGSQTATEQSSTDTSSQEINQYYAEDVEGVVVEVFSTAIVAGDVSENDKTVIDEALLSIENVESVSSQFTQIDSANATLTYLANIKLKENADKTVFVDSVSMLEYFVLPEIYFEASIEVATEHEVLNEQQQLTRITLPNAQIPAIVFAQTQKGDTVSGTLAAAFQGAQLVSAYVLENQNLTASPTPISFSEIYSVAQLLPALSVAGTVEYYPGFSLELLQSDLEELSGVESVDVPFFPNVNNTLSVSYPDANAVEDELQLYVDTHPESFSTFVPFSGGFQVKLNQVTVSEAKVLLTEAIASFTFVNPNLSFEAPRNQFLVDVNTLNAENGNVAASMTEYFQSLDANAVFEVYQNGFVSAETITSQEGQTYAVPNGLIATALTPGHAVGDEVLILVNAIALRGELAYVNGVENPSE